MKGINIKSIIRKCKHGYPIGTYLHDILASPNLTEEILNTVSELASYQDYPYIVKSEKITSEIYENILRKAIKHCFTPVSYLKEENKRILFELIDTDLFNHLTICLLTAEVSRIDELKNLTYVSYKLMFAQEFFVEVLKKEQLSSFNVFDIVQLIMDSKYPKGYSNQTYNNDISLDNMGKIFIKNAINNKKFDYETYKYIEKMLQKIHQSEAKDVCEILLEICKSRSLTDEMIKDIVIFIYEKIVRDLYAKDEYFDLLKEMLEIKNINKSVIKYSVERLHHYGNPGTYGNRSRTLFDKVFKTDGLIDLYSIQELYKEAYENLIKEPTLNNYFILEDISDIYISKKISAQSMDSEIPQLDFKKEKLVYLYGLADSLLDIYKELESATPKEIMDYEFSAHVYRIVDLVYKDVRAEKGQSRSFSYYDFEDFEKEILKRRLVNAKFNKGEPQNDSI